MARIIRDEPCTIDAEVIAELLESSGYLRMANFVRRLNERDSSHTVRYDELRQRYNALVEKFCQSETPRPPVSYRSQWE